MRKIFQLAYQIICIMTLIELVLVKRAGLEQSKLTIALFIITFTLSYIKAICMTIKLIRR